MGKCAKPSFTEPKVLNGAFRLLTCKKGIAVTALRLRGLEINCAVNQQRALSFKTIIYIYIYFYIYLFILNALRNDIQNITGVSVILHYDTLCLGVVAMLHIHRLLLAEICYCSSAFPFPPQSNLLASLTPSLPPRPGLFAYVASAQPPRGLSRQAGCA